ncbi:unnamed protein product [Moneuplotes crassus]|uniref:Uncharacterized protein n=1 Tax=Euplotes crassus TaxID=5936 RepID=A0AAD1U6G4_EUPCR|nr:unnamed protein product [Moneuplotes crassus]
MQKTSSFFQTNNSSLNTLFLFFQTNPSYTCSKPFKRKYFSMQKYYRFKIQSNKHPRDISNKSVTKGLTKNTRKTLSDLISCMTTDPKRHGRNLSQTKNPMLSRRVNTSVLKLKSPQKLASKKNIRKEVQNKSQIRPSFFLGKESCDKDNEQKNDSEEAEGAISHLKASKEQIEKDFDRFYKDKPSEKKQIMNLSKLVKHNMKVFRKRLEYLNYDEFISSKPSPDLFEKSLKRLRRGNNYGLRNMHENLKKVEHSTRQIKQKTKDRKSQQELTHFPVVKDDLKLAMKISKFEKLRKSNNHSSALSKREVIKVFQKPKMRPSNSRFQLEPLFSKSDL